MIFINFVEKRGIMSRYWNTIDLGKSPLKPHCFYKPIAWPVYAWKAILPTVLTDQLDILQKLILSLAKIQKLKDPTILYQLGISKELIQSVKQSCIFQGYLDNENSLTKSGKQLLSNSMNIEHGMLMNYDMFIFLEMP